MADVPTSSDSAGAAQDGHRRPPTNLHRSVSPKHVKLAYRFLFSHGLYLLLPLLAALCIGLASVTSGDLLLIWEGLRFTSAAVIGGSGVLVFLPTLYFMKLPCPVYLVDFACCKPSSELKCPRELFMEHSTLTGIFSEENLEFQKKILERSGLGQSTYFPRALFKMPPDPCMAEARKETEMVMFGAMDDLFDKTGVKAKDIDILIVNCSLFNPTPSLSAMVVNRYKLRANIQSFNLGGMGCSAGVISIDLANLLKYNL